MKVNVQAEILNMPANFENEPGWLVVRRDDNNERVTLWYFGFFEDKERADMAAYQINNGIVLEVEG